ncbi:MAG TPA: UvrD-helicase domain-containing protein [Gemmatimonadaceae bacterium]|nr:UvrD-helicase domain-containing protein [Gemmatimonadaceae bacterium]
MSTLLDDKLTAGLNPAQREAVLHVNGALLVLAGAGSGKTRVLTTRIARLIDIEGADARDILAVTFTNKAAGEMRERVGRLLGQDPAGMWIGTFHAIGARMLRAAAHLVGRTPSFTIYDQDDSLSVIKRLMDRHHVSTKQFSPRAVQGAISDAKNALVPPKEYERLAMEPFSKAIAPIYQSLGETLQTANAVDFDDLLVLPVRMLQQHPEKLESYRRRFKYILVDEYQDTNRAQYELIKLLGGEHGNVCVVGDDDQSIYGWRGADIRNILDFNKDFPSAAVVRLEQNYRSTPQILDLANVVISANTGRMGKTLRATHPSGEQVTLVRSLDERDEAEFIVAELAARRSARSLANSDVAVLYRTNAQSRALEESLRRHAIPYRLVGAVRFYDRREIRDLMAYLKLVANPSDDEAFRRAVSVPKRGLGETTIELLAEGARNARVSLFDAAHDPSIVTTLRAAARVALGEFVRVIAGLRDRASEAAVDELLREIVEAIRYGDYLRAEGPESAERLDNVRELITGAAETVADELGEVGLRPLDHFLQRSSLVADSDALGGDADAVTLMTLHNAKGLEFPVVFITGLEDGLFPLAKAYDDPPLLEEERRLFYVGITRARQKLYLSHAEERRRNGELLGARQSSFLDGIPPAMLEKRSTIKVRSSGRSFMRAGGDSSGYNSVRGSYGRAGGGDGGFERRSRLEIDLDEVTPRASAAARRPGMPVGFTGGIEYESQDAPNYVIGARVKHRKFGSGTIAELAGVGRDAKVKVDFDDEAVGRKTLVIAQANLERADD